MSLDWDCSHCATPTATTDTEAATRKCLVFESMAIGLGEVTEENIPEWVFRSTFLQRVDLSTIMYSTEDRDEQVAYLQDGLRRWVGMTTNVPNEDRDDWLVSVMRRLERSVERSLPKNDEND